MPRASLSSLLLGVLLAASAPAQEPPPGAVLATLPFLESGEVNRIFVDLAKPDSRRRLRLMLDTGASDSILTAGAAREAGVRVRRLKRDPYRRSTLLGRDLLFHIDARRSETASRTGWEYGLLGGTFLADYVLELDFEARVVRMIDPDRYEVPERVEAEGEVVLPLEVVANRAGLVMTVQGRPVRVLLDTGVPFGLLLSGAVAERAGVASRAVPGFQLSGVFGELGSELGEAERTALGPFEIERYPVAVARHGNFNQGFPADSIIGYDLLSQFQVRVDYPRRRLWLRRREGAPETFLGVDYAVYRESGALLVPHPEGYQVLLVDEGSVAAARGTAPGMVLSEPKIPAGEDRGTMRPATRGADVAAREAAAEVDPEALAPVRP
ncbi:MAG: aspartyl protease family protein, partial [Myxococcota bacterium]